MSSSFVSNNNYLRVSDRPTNLQQEIDDSFEGLARAKSSGWGLFNGSAGYSLCGVDEYALMGRIIEEAPKQQKEFWALDIGAGNFDWGKGLAKYLNKQTDLPKDIHVHIVGVRGETNIEEKVVELDICTLHQLGAFKVEAIFEQFRTLGFNVENKLDLVVSRWTFRHLVDPVGTFIQTYDLLRPGSGCFLFDGFFFLYEDQKELEDYTEQLVIDTKAPFLKRFWDVTRSCDQFFLKRPNDRPCQVAMSYLGYEEVNGYSWQIGSNFVTRFKREKSEEEEKYCDQYFNTDHVVGEKKIYQWLRNHALFAAKTLIWQPLTEKDRCLATFALHQAVREGSREAVEAALKQGNDINESDLTGATALHIAIEKGDKVLVTLLLSQKPLLTLCDANGNTPLSLACSHDKEGSVITALIQAGANVNDWSLMHAIWGENKKAAEILIASGAIINEREKKGLEKLGIKVEVTK